MNWELTRIDFMHLLEQQSIAESPLIPSIEERCNFIAKAAQRKLVDWLSSTCREHSTHIDPECKVRADCWQCWQELRKAVGL